MYKKPIRWNKGLDLPLPSASAGFSKGEGLRFLHKPENVIERHWWFVNEARKRTVGSSPTDKSIIRVPPLPKQKRRKGFRLTMRKGGRRGADSFACVPKQVTRPEELHQPLVCPFTCLVIVSADSNLHQSAKLFVHSSQTTPSSIPIFIPSTAASVPSNLISACIAMISWISSALKVISTLRTLGSLMCFSKSVRASKTIHIVIPAQNLSATTSSFPTTRTVPKLPTKHLGRWRHM